MPIYEYRCKKCGHHLELLQKVGDPAPKSCPNCRKGKMEKLVSRTSFQLKGSGWYASDYAKPTAKKSEDKPENKSETKSESQPESKSDSKADKTATKPSSSAA